jgi:cysteine desulfurase
LIYFDSAASYPVLPVVVEALRDAFIDSYGNSMALHRIGARAFEEVELVRLQLADAIGAFKSEIVFTSGATESNNLALKGLLLKPGFDTSKKHIVTSAVEHKCIHSICAFMETQGFDVTLVKPDSDGFISASSINEALREDTCLVSVMHANNETGVINDIANIGELCVNRKILFHIDAAQTFCKLPIDVDDLNADVMSFSAHKIGGPKGVGAIYIRDLRKINLTPVIHGAGQEEGVRGGTVPSPLIIGFGAAIAEFPKVYGQLKEAQLKEILISILNESNIEFSINGNINNSLPNIVSITFPTIDLSVFIRKTENSFCLAQGSACSSTEIEPSHVLTSIGLNTKMAEKTLRLSLGHYNDRADIVALVNALSLM